MHGSSQEQSPLAVHKCQYMIVPEEINYIFGWILNLRCGIDYMPWILTLF